MGYLAVIVKLLGGWRATAFLALALAAMGYSGVQSVRLNRAQALSSKLLTRAALEIVARAKAEAQASESARAEEHARAQAVNAAAQSYEKGKHDGQMAANQLRDDVADGRLVLRDKFRCPAAHRVPDTPATTAGSDGGATGILSAADQDVLVRVGSDADSVAKQLAACQAVIRAYVEPAKQP